MAVLGSLGSSMVVFSDFGEWNLDGGGRGGVSNAAVVGLGYSLSKGGGCRREIGPVVD